MTRAPSAAARCLVGAMLVAASAVALLAPDASAVGRARGPGASPRINYFGDGLGAPQSIAADGTDFWVADPQAHSLTEFSESTGTVLRVIDTSDFQPAELAVDASGIWAVDQTGDQLVEFSTSTGQVLDSVALPDPACGVPSPGCDPPFPFAFSDVSSDGVDVWVTNSQTDVVTEVSASSGTVVRVITPAGSRPVTVDADGTDVWVVVSGGVDEYTAATGAFVRQIGLPGASDALSDGTNVWVADGTHVAELSAASGDVLGSTATAALQGGASGLADDGTHVWATTAVGLEELSATSGDAIRYVHGPTYRFAGVGGVVSNGSRVWVVDQIYTATTTYVPGGLTELSALTAAPILAPWMRYSLNQPRSIVATPSKVFVGGMTLGPYPGAQPGSVTELDATSGRQTGFLDGASAGLSWPSQMIDDGPDVWVLSWGGPTSGLSSLTELSATTGAVIRLVEVPTDGYGDQPTMTLSAGRLWVVAAPISVVEYSATSGAPLDSFNPSQFGLPKDVAFAVAASDGNVWLAGTGRLAEVRATTGALEHVYAGPSYAELAEPDDVQMLSVDGRLWTDSVATDGTVSLTAYSEATGAIVGGVDASDLGVTDFYVPTVAGSNLWGVGWGSQGSVVLELSGATGALEHSYGGAAYRFLGPSAISVYGAHVWVANVNGDSVTEWRV